MKLCVRFDYLVMLVAFIIMAIADPTYASSVVLQWDPNTEKDLAGYKIYYNIDALETTINEVGFAGSYSPIDVRNQTSVTLNGLDSDRDYYFAVTAYNRSGAESEFSDILFIPKLSSSVSPSIPFTIYDAMLALRAAVGKVTLTAVDVSRLDVAPVVKGVSAPNGKIDAADAIVILSRVKSK